MKGPALRRFAYSMLLAVLGNLAAASGIAAPKGAVEISHRGVKLVGVPPDPAAAYDVRVIGARQAVNRIRAALDRLLEVSPYSMAALRTLRNNGLVTIIYHPGFPPKDASSAGVRLATFKPYLFSRSREPGARPEFPVIVSRYFVKREMDALVLGLAHELLGHGLQHLRGRLVTMSKNDKECDASLYEEMVRQNLGMDKRSRVSVSFRQVLEWRWCVPFRQYMTKHSPAKMALWKKMNPDVRQLHAIFEQYLRSIGIR